MSPESRVRVSVIIPTYNRARLLSRAVSSVLRQTYEDHEIIIVDDCSIDDTPQVIQSYADPRIRSVRHNRNAGLPTSRNTGIQMARGEYVAFLDDDDECLPERLELQSAGLDANPNVGLIYGWIEEFNDETGHHRIPVGQNTHRGRAAFDAALTGLSPMSSMAYPMYRAEVLSRINGCQEGLSIGEDAILIAMATQIYNADVVERVICRCHVNHVYQRMSQSYTRDSMRRYTETHWKFFKDDLKKRPHIEAEWRAGNAAGWMGARAVVPALLELSRAIRLRPFDRANARRVFLVVRTFLWYATPLRRLGRQARNVRSRLFGNRSVR